MRPDPPTGNPPPGRWKPPLPGPDPAHHSMASLGEGRRNHALDDHDHPAGAVGAGPRVRVGAWRLGSHLADPRRRLAHPGGEPTRLGRSLTLTGPGPAHGRTGLSRA